jgi:hypothetical protein
MDRGRLLFSTISYGKEEVLNRYFNDITVEGVESEEAWNRINDKPRLWK